MTGVLYQAAQALPAARNNHGETIGVLRTRFAGAAPDLQILVLDTPGLTGVDVPNAYVIAASAIQPFSRGSVRLAGSAPDLPPVVDPNYLGDARDMKTLVEGISVARDIGSAPAFDTWRGAELGPGPQFDSRDELQEFVKQTVGTYFHPAGTCAMGHSEQSVVDDELRVRGVTGLRVVDASVMPSLPSNNLLATVYGIAERAAVLIKCPTRHHTSLTAV